MAAADNGARVAVIVGCGSKHDKDGAAGDMRPAARFGLGGALSLRFAAGGYHVALLCRRAAVGEAVLHEVRAAGGAGSLHVCDVTDDASVGAALEGALAVGEVDVLVYNCAPPFPPGASFGNLPRPEEVDPAYLQQGFDIGCTGLLRCVRHVVGPMVARKRGTILVSGATMGVRGGADFACMAPVKFALRGLSQSMYQQYAPLGVHVAHVVIDGVIESPNTKAWEGKVMLQKPEALADAYFDLHRQPPTCWSFEQQLSPHVGGVGMRL